MHCVNNLKIIGKRLTRTYVFLRLGSRRSRNGDSLKRAGGAMPTMEPIQQSPLRSTKSEGYHYFIPAPSPVEYESPEREFTRLQPCISAPLAQSTPLKYTTEAQVERSASASSLEPTDGATLDSIASDYTALDSTNMDRDTPDPSGFIDDSMPKELAGLSPPLPPPTGSRGVTPPKPPRVGLDFSSMERNSGATPSLSSKYTTANDVTSNVADASTFDMTDEEVKLHNKMDNMASPDNYKLTFPGHESMFNETQDFGDESYVRHSPDEYSHQVGYDPLLGHYSHGGRGYPHGTYISPSPSSGHGEDLLAEVHDPSNLQSLTPSGGEEQPPGGSTQQHCDHKDNSYNGGGNAGVLGNQPPQLPPCTNTGLSANNLQQQLDNIKSPATQQHNGLNVAGERNALTTTTTTTTTATASPGQPLLNHDVQFLNQQNSFSDSDKDLLLPNERDTSQSRGAFIVNRAGPAESLV